MPIEYKKGDATDTSAATPNKPLIIAHVCNNTGAWGAGFTGAIDRALGPRPRVLYRRWYNRYEEDIAHDPEGLPGEFLPPVFALGQVQLVRVEDDAYVANMIAQNGLYSASNPVPLQYGELAECLYRLNLLAQLLVSNPVREPHGVQIQMPRIDAGLARGDWTKIAPLIVQYLSFPVTVLDLQE